MKRELASLPALGHAGSATETGRRQDQVLAGCSTLPERARRIPIARWKLPPDGRGLPR